MVSDDPRARQVSRRELLRVAGLGGISAAALGLAGGMAHPRLVGAAADDSLPEGFLANAFAVRARAMSAGDGAGLDALYDAASGTLLKYEKERASFFKRGLGANWAGSAILDFSSKLELIALTVAGDTATARLYEATTFQWIPRPLPIPMAAQDERKRDPARFRPVETGARGEVTSAFGNRHEVTLVKGPGGWRIAKDAYDQKGLYLASPDLAPGSWAEDQVGGPTGIPTGTPTAEVTAMAYNRDLAVQGANNNALVYNYQYCNFAGCGGDCGNFVSQCFRAGGHAQTGAWFTYSGSCGVGGCGSATYAGSDTWSNNKMLRDFINTSGRGTPVADEWQVGRGDIINYAWPGSCGNYDNEVDHIVLVTGTTGSGPIICSHTPDLKNVLWPLTSCGGRNYATFSHVY